MAVPQVRHSKRGFLRVSGVQIVDQFEEVLVLVALLALEEVGETIARLELGVWAEDVREPKAGIPVT